MAFFLKITSTKPEGTQWAADAMPEVNQRYFAWVRQYPGVICMGNYKFDENTNERFFVFASKEVYETWMVDRTQNEDFQIRLAHQDESGHTTTIDTFEA